jgi:hypothetical protein
MRAVSSAEFRRFSGQLMLVLDRSRGSMAPIPDPSPFDAPLRGLVVWYGKNAQLAEPRTNSLAAGLRLVPFVAAQKTIFQFGPNICCMWLLNGHFRGHTECQPQLST